VRRLLPQEHLSDGDAIQNHQALNTGMQEMKANDAIISYNRCEQGRHSTKTLISLVLFQTRCKWLGHHTEWHSKPSGVEVQSAQMVRKCAMPAKVRG
jgi:hypothetical protein